MAKAAALGRALLRFGLAVGHILKSMLYPARLARLALPSLATLLRAEKIVFSRIIVMFSE
jgi:hypothetical protein